MKKTFNIVYVMASNKRIIGKSFMNEIITIDLNDFEDSFDLIKHFWEEIRPYEEINIISITEMPYAT